MRLLVALFAAAASPALAANSAPQPIPIVDTIPAARDIAYPGTMMLNIAPGQNRWRHGHL